MESRIWSKWSVYQYFYDCLDELQRIFFQGVKLLNYSELSNIKTN